MAPRRLQCPAAQRSAPQELRKPDSVGGLRPGRHRRRSRRSRVLPPGASAVGRKCSSSDVLLLHIPSSRTKRAQAARRGAKSCMISAELAGGDCLNSGCVPSKALLRCAKLIREARKAAAPDNEFGVSFRQAPSDDAPMGKKVEVRVSVDFPTIMRRMRRLRSQIAPVDGHERGDSIGTQTFQGRGVFVSPTTVEVVEHGKTLGDATNPRLRFKRACIATGGRPSVPDGIPGLKEAPFTTNLSLFNLQQLPERMVIVGAGIVALEMAQCFATFGSKVTVLQRSRLISKGEDEAAQVLRSTLEKDGVRFLSGVDVKEVDTLRQPSETELPLMSVALTCNEHSAQLSLGCECLLLALGRTANVQSMGLETAHVQYHASEGVLVNDFAQSVSNPNVYAVGDCVANVPRLTHSKPHPKRILPFFPRETYFLTITLICHSVWRDGQGCCSKLSFPRSMEVVFFCSTGGDVYGARICSGKQGRFFGREWPGCPCHQRRKRRLGCFQSVTDAQ
ncbi:hypothetical protein ACHAWF_004457 [Thalassiosira exigua]